MAKNLVFVPDCPSTNTLALQISQQSAVNEGTVVITNHQTAGKGQRGNTWEAEPQKNLTFSLILKPGFLAVNKQFFLNIVVCLALTDYLKEKTFDDDVYIKWPNDILVHEKKISGVLIENQLQGNTITNTIAGIGFNINQKNFDGLAATSLSLLSGNNYALDQEFAIMAGFIESRYLQLRAGHYDMLMNAYLTGLFRRHERHSFSSNGRVFEGIIEDVDEVGRLRIRVGEEVRAFGVKEVQYLG